MPSPHERTLHKQSPELRDVHMYVYTEPDGLLGRLIGRALRLRVREFAFTVNRNSALRRVEVDTSSVTPEYEVFSDEAHTERQSLTVNESRVCLRRLQREVLQPTLHPYAYFDVTHEDMDSIDGTLGLHGVSAEVQCSKALRNNNNLLVVRCPLRLSTYNIQRSSILLGLLRVADEVVVETQVPVQLLQS